MSEKSLLDAMVIAGLVCSKAEARRLIVSGNVLVNDTKTKDTNGNVNTGDVIKVGKNRTATV